MNSAASSYGAAARGHDGVGDALGGPGIPALPVDDTTGVVDDHAGSAGGFAMFDTTSAYRLEFVGEPATQEWDVVSFRVPRIQLIPLLADPRAFTAVTHDASTGGAASLVASTMMPIWNPRLR